MAETEQADQHALREIFSFLDTHATLFLASFNPRDLKGTMPPNPPNHLGTTVLLGPNRGRGFGSNSTLIDSVQTSWLLGQVSSAGGGMACSLDRQRHGHASNNKDRVVLLQGLRVGKWLHPMFLKQQFGSNWWQAFEIMALSCPEPVLLSEMRGFMPFGKIISGANHGFSRWVAFLDTVH